MQKRACDAPGARVVFNRIDTAFLPPGPIATAGRFFLQWRLPVAGGATTRRQLARTVREGFLGITVMLLDDPSNHLIELVEKVARIRWRKLQRDAPG